MNMKVTCFIVATLAFYSLAANPANQPTADTNHKKSIIVHGIGALSCGQVLPYLKAAQAATTPQPLTMNISVGDEAEAWTQGYLTGLNVALGGKADIEGDTDPSAMTQWLINWCQANPLSNLYTAANKLSVELLKQHKK